MTVLNVNDIATDADLAIEFGGVDSLNSAQKLVSIRDAYRASALQDCIDQLSTRKPPVLPQDLTYPSELKMAVVYRALQKICARAMTQAGDRHDMLARKYQADFTGAISRRFSVAPGGSTSSARSFNWGRR